MKTKCTACKGKGYIGWGDFDDTFCDICGGKGKINKKDENISCEMLFLDKGKTRTVYLKCDEIVFICRNGFRVRTIDNEVNSSSVVKLWKPGFAQPNLEGE